MSASRKPATLKPARTPTKFTFGIELELLLAVDARVSIDPNFDPWLNIASDEQRHPSDLPGYQPGLEWNIPLTQLGKILRRHRPTVLLHPDPHHDTDFKEWFVTTETAVNEAWAHLSSDKKEKMREWSNGQTDGKEHHTVERGLELVSRILPLPSHKDSGEEHASLVEIRGMVDALKPQANDHFICFSEVEIAGLHVHVGLEQPEKFVQESDEESVDESGFRKRAHVNREHMMDLKTLQHLAYILTEYEDIISSFHHPERRGWPYTKTDIQAKSNRFGISGHCHLCRIPLPTLPKVREFIFVESERPTQKTKEDAIRDSLAHLLGQENPPMEGDVRKKFVNWTNIHDDLKPPTIEFRQHHGTLNFEDIKQWILFISALMHAAEDMAIGVTAPPSPNTQSWAERQGKKYKGLIGLFSTRHENKEARMAELFELLRLVPEQCDYWRARAVQYDIAKLDQDERSKYEMCPECNTQTAESPAKEPGTGKDANSGHLASDSFYESESVPEKDKGVSEESVAEQGYDTTQDPDFDAKEQEAIRRSIAKHGYDAREAPGFHN